MRDKGGEDEFLTASWFKAFAYCVPFFASNEMLNCRWVSNAKCEASNFSESF